MNLDKTKQQFHEQIFEGMARTLWLLAYADWAEEDPEPGEDEDDPDNVEESDRARPGPGGDWDDVAPETPETPEAAYMAAADLMKRIAKSEGFEKEKWPLAELFEMAMTIDTGEPFEFESETPKQRAKKAGRDEATEADSKLALAEEFGSDLAHMGVGTGVSWFDDHKQRNKGAEWDPKWPGRFECHYDGEQLSWYGERPGSGHQQARYQSPEEPTLTGEIGEGTTYSPEITYINENDKNFYDHSYVLQFGGSTYLMVYAASLDDALDEAIDWLVDNAPGHIVDDQVKEAYDELIAEYVKKHGHEPDQGSRALDRIYEEAEQDTTAGGNAGNHINSEEWGIVAEDPSKLDLLRIIGVLKNPARRHELVQNAPRAKKEPRTPYDILATFLFKDTVTARMLRMVLERGPMAQADFMRVYMARCERPPSEYQQRKAAQQRRPPKATAFGFLSNFGRFVSHYDSRSGEQWPWVNAPFAASTLQTRPMFVFRQQPDSGQHRDHNRFLLTWVGPPMEELLAKMSNDTLQKSYEQLERQLLEPRATDNPEETNRWLERLKHESLARVRMNPTNLNGDETRKVCPQAYHDGLKADDERWRRLKLLGIQEMEADPDDPVNFPAEKLEVRDCDSCKSTLYRTIKENGRRSAARSRQYVPVAAQPRRR